MSELYFENCANVGNLYLDYVFYEFEKEPILFTCVDKSKNLYFCLCVDIRYEQIWLISKTNISILKDLIDERIDIASAFLTQEKLIKVNMDLEGNEKSQVIDRESINDLDIPKQGTFIHCDVVKARNYIWQKELGILMSKAAEVLYHTQSNSIMIETSCTLIDDINENELLINLYDERNKGMNNILDQYYVNTKDQYIELVEDLSIDDSEYLEAA